MNAIKPVFWILKIFSLHYISLNNDNTVDEDQTSDCKTIVLTDFQSHNKYANGAFFAPLRVYALAACILLWFNARRFIPNLIIFINTP